MSPKLLAAAISLLLLLSGCAAPPAGQAPEPPPPVPAADPAPEPALRLQVEGGPASPGSTVTVSLRVQDPSELPRTNPAGGFEGWLCLRDCGGDGATASLSFAPSPADPHLFTARFTVPLLLRRSVVAAVPEFEPVAAGEYPLHAACVLDGGFGCAQRSEVSTTVTLSQGVNAVAWEQLTAGDFTPVPRLGELAATARSPVPGSQRSVECLAGSLDPRMGVEPPRLLLTDDAGQPLPPLILGGEGSPLFGRHGYAGCGAVALDPIHGDTYYLMEAPHAGGAEPGAYPWPQFTRDGGATWEPVPAPAGFEARRNFAGFALSPEGVTAWFSQAGLEEFAVAAEQIRGSLTRDGGETWSTVKATCPDGLAHCLLQLRDRPPTMRSGLIRSLDGGQGWTWAAGDSRRRPGDQA